MAAASWILCKLAKQPYLPEPVFQIKRGQYETILENLQDDDVACLGHCEDIAVDLEEVRRPHAFGKAFRILHYDPRCEFCAVQPHA